MSAILDAARAKRAALQTDLDSFIDEIEKRDDPSMTDDDKTDFEARTVAIVGEDDLIGKLEESEARAKAAADAAAKVDPDIRVGREPLTYEQYNNERSFFRDMATIASNAIGANVAGETQARERMARHNREIEVESRQRDREHRGSFDSFIDQFGENASYEQRVNPNTTAGTGGEFVPPLWLVDLYAPLERAGRVIANRIGSKPLPGGIDVINLPKITTGTLTGSQTANAVPVTSRDIVTTSVSANVITIAGQEDISMQLLEQSPISMDSVIFDDLSRDYDLQLDRQVIAGAGSSLGQHRGVLAQTAATANSTTVFNTDITKANQVTCASVLFWDGTTATSFTQYRSIVNGVTNVELLRFASPTAIWGHPRRINSWALAADSTIGRPLFTQYGAFNNLGVQENSPQVQGVAGELYGLPVVKDPNIPITCATNSVSLTGTGTGDVIAVVKEDDMLLWEGTMRMRALPEVLSGTLQVRFQIYAYSAFLPDRFAPSTSIITGTTGLAAPSW